MFWRILILVFGGSLISTLTRWILQFKYKISDDEERLRSELKNCREELKGISAVDEFARYARLKRKMNTVEEELVGKISVRQNDRDAVEKKVATFCHVVIGALLVYTIITSRNVPVLHFPANWFWPLGWLFRFPIGEANVLGCSTWLIICKTASRVLIK